jgi:hypothetical protein
VCAAAAFFPYAYSMAISDVVQNELGFQLTNARIVINPEVQSAGSAIYTNS